MPFSYYIDKRSGSAADTLLAAGFARMIQALLLQTDSPADELRIVDDGPYYRVEAPRPIDDGELERITALNFVQHLDTAAQKDALGRHYGQGFPYDQQRRIRDEYREKRKALPTAARSPDAYLLNDPALAALHAQITPPDTLLPLYLVINQMKVASSFNEPVIRWRELPPELLRRHIRLLLDLFSATPNPLEATVAAWRALANTDNLGDASMTMLQVINPTTGKGANRTKADALTIRGLDEFWLLELLKFAGFFALAHPQTITDSKNRKTYVLRPRNIRLSLVDEVMRTFREVLWASTPAKLDVLAVLMFTRVLVRHERNALSAEEGDRPPWDVCSPADRVQGLDVAFYKDMGSSFAVMNVASLALPEWLPPIDSAARAERIEGILKEHTEVIRSVRSGKDEERTEEYELLRRYRDFLSGRDVAAFLEFAALFATYISRKIDRKEYVRRFTIHSLKELFAMTRQDFTEVINDKGFQNIADAIRRSTVTLQYQKGMGQRVPFDIRYGLAQELVRSANDADGFVAALSDFVMRYNSETAQTFETSKGEIRRKRLSEDDLAAIVRLLGKGYRPKTLAQLLVAFGSAKAGDEPDAPGSPSPIEENEMETEE
jgi:hypothetical protein